MGLINGFKLKISEPKKPKKSSESKIGKITTGIVIETSNGYAVSIGSDKEKPIILPFTDDSFELKGRRVVFIRGTKIRIIRGKEKAKHFPGTPEQYMPFAVNWTVKGYVIKIDSVIKFKFKTLVGINGYVIEKDYE